MTLNKDSQILVVDDSPAILALMKDTLTAKGYKNVRTATSVDEALKAVDEASPDIVFLDLMMPDASGLDFTQKVFETDPNIRVVVTTALPPSHESVTMAISQGAVEYLQKPLHKESVSRVLDHLDDEDTRKPFDAAYG
jgi:DNA-binding NtrC family response regulator